MINIILFTIIIPSTCQLKIRLDKVLSQLFPEYSRTCLKKWILNNQISINGVVCNKPSINVYHRDEININVVKHLHHAYIPQDIHINVIYEDNDILVIDKQANLVVHPGAGNKYGTLLNALLYRDSNFLSVPRCGIVHRLDKNTTGLMVIAKNIESYNNLIESMRSRKIIRQYEAVVYGKLISGGGIFLSIQRHPIQRTMMTTSITGKSAITHYRIVKRFSYCTHITVRLETGRTHQIRVHMLSINHPVVGDKIYRNKYKFCKSITSKMFEIVKKFPRQALHASKLCLKHPITGIWMEWNSVLPKDILNLLSQLNIYNDE
ncbi:MAG: 23S rRNA pseudouridine(1911/1915/1917) synthase RluD [Buchnera aphidicola (Melaphis rhois)]